MIVIALVNGLFCSLQFEIENFNFGVCNNATHNFIVKIPAQLSSINVRSVCRNRNIRHHVVHYVKRLTLMHDVNGEIIMGVETIFVNFAD